MKTTECLLGLMLADENVDPQIAQKALKTSEGKTTYAQALGRHDRDMWGRVGGKSKAMMNDFFGFDVFSEVKVLTGLPEEVLGQPITNLVSKMEDFQSRGGGWEQYRTEFKPVFDEMLDIADTLDGPQSRLMRHVVDVEQRGYSLFPEKFHKDRTPIGKVVSKVLGNLVSNNPVIAMYNFFEIMPKAYAYAASSGPNAEAIMFKTMGDFMRVTGGKFWLKPEGVPPEIFQAVSRSKFAQAMEKRIGFGNIVDAAENPLRTFSYLLGENMGGLGRQAVQDIAFTFRPGNVPMAFSHPVGAAEVNLMRFSIRAMQFYGGLAKRAIVNRDPRAAMALVGFHAFTAMQTGITSTIPKPVWLALPEEYKEQIKKLNKEFPSLTNVVGVDISEQTQPFGGVAISVGGAITTQSVGAGLVNLAKAPGITLDDPLVGMLTAFQGIAQVGQTGKIPLNYNSVRILRALKKAAENNELNFEGVGEASLESFNLK